MSLLASLLQLLLSVVNLFTVVTWTSTPTTDKVTEDVLQDPLTYEDWLRLQMILDHSMGFDEW